MRSKLHSCIDAQFTAWLWLNPGAGLFSLAYDAGQRKQPKHRSRSEPSIVVFGNRPGKLGTNALLVRLPAWEIQPFEPEM